MSSWQEDKLASDVYIDEIKMILGKHLIDEAPMEEDAKRNTDLIIPPLRIACRVRSDNYIEEYGNEFTIRSKRPKHKTELRKTIEGWGNYMFYGFGDGKMLTKWTLIDLNVFRSVIFDLAYKDKMPESKPNFDGSSWLMPFEFSIFPDELIVATWQKKSTESGG